ncbi:uncharacterized protein [Clytia hemisphaerica]|uniref:Uncharacterized protein n=1 Tax=Clytia hemisphaerica TaxID=252671 RepID=A0A7M5TRM7_9CNID
MGSGCSAPLPDLPYKDIMAMSFRNDSIVCFYASKAELEITRNAILRCWPGGIQREGPKNLDEEHPDVGEPKCYKFKLTGYPFTIGGSKENSTAVRRMATAMLFELYNLGWKLLVSSDLSRTMDVGTWFFQKEAHAPMQYPMFCIGISSYDKFNIIDCPTNLHSVIRDVCTRTWASGIQNESLDGNVYTIKFNGTPWSYVDKIQSCTSRLMIREIVGALTGYQVMLYGNTNLKSTADTFFFRYVPNQQAEQFTTVSLNRMDRLRLIHMEPNVVSAIENCVRQTWVRGVQEVLDKRPLCYELKLRGYPWWCYGEEGVSARLLICRILETMASIGYYIVSGLDVTRKDNDKSLLLFRQGAPMQARFLVCSLNSTDKVKLINAPNEVVQAAQRIFALWVLGHQVKPAAELPPGCSYQVKLNGNPWSNMMVKDGYHGRALLLGLLGAFSDLGWRLVTSADVSAKYVHQDKGPDYPLDVHSWYFMYDPSLLAQRQPMHQQYGLLYPTLPVQGGPPPVYYAPPPAYAPPPPGYNQVAPPPMLPQ